MAEVINPQKTVPSGADVTPPEGGRNDSEEVVSVAEMLSEATGRTFKDDEAALSSVRETYKYVGWGGKVKPVFEQLKAKLGSEDAAIKFMEEQAKTTTTQSQPETKPEVVQPKDDGLAKEVEGLKLSLKEKDFYLDNPDYKPYRDLIRSLGSDPEKVIQTDVFKSTFSKLKAHDETENSKSVIHSNPRIGQVTDKISKAREAVKAGNHSEAAANAVDAVLDAYERK